MSITDLWYNSEMPSYAPYYGQAQPGGSNFNNVFGSFGHFTQVVWKGTTQVGCYTYTCPNGISGVGGNVPPYLTVCNYKAPGKARTYSRSNKRDRLILYSRKLPEPVRYQCWPTIGSCYCHWQLLSYAGYAQWSQWGLFLGMELGLTHHGLCIPPFILASLHARFNSKSFSA